MPNPPSLDLTVTIGLQEITYDPPSRRARKGHNVRFQLAPDRNSATVYFDSQVFLVDGQPVSQITLDKKTLHVDTTISPQASSGKQLFRTPISPSKLGATMVGDVDVVNNIPEGRRGPQRKQSQEEAKGTQQAPGER